MIVWTIKWLFISFILIFLVHNIVKFLITTLTVPKIKDLVVKPTNTYKEIYSLQESKLLGKHELHRMPPDLQMENELNIFLTELKKPK